MRLVTTYRRLRPGDRIGDGCVTSRPIRSAWGKGFVSFSMQGDGWAAIKKARGDEEVVVTRQ